MTGMERMMSSYPVEIVPGDNDTFLVTFPDVPGAVTYGETRVEALENAVDALEAVLSGLIVGRKDIPAPSAARGRPVVSLSLLGSLKVAVYRAMRARGWRKADLARALGLNPRQIDRLLDLRHGSTVGQLEKALLACGRRVEIETRGLEAA
jgi:antitoxin HicB